MSPPLLLLLLLHCGCSCNCYYDGYYDDSHGKDYDHDYNQQPATIIVTVVQGTGVFRCRVVKMLVAAFVVFLPPRRRAAI